MALRNNEGGFFSSFFVSSFSFNAVSHNYCYGLGIVFICVL